MSCTSTNVLDLCIQPNASFELDFRLLQDDGITPINITSWSFTGSIKESFPQQTASLYFTMSLVSVESASLRMLLGAADTWRLTGSRYVYDLLADNPLAVPPETYRLMQGKISAKPGVTAP